MAKFLDNLLAWKSGAKALPPLAWASFIEISSFFTQAEKTAIATALTALEATPKGLACLHQLKNNMTGPKIYVTKSDTPVAVYYTPALGRIEVNLAYKTATFKKGQVTFLPLEAALQDALS